MSKVRNQGIKKAWNRFHLGVMYYYDGVQHFQFLCVCGFLSLLNLQILRKTCARKVENIKYLNISLGEVDMKMTMAVQPNESDGMINVTYLYALSSISNKHTHY